MLLVMSLLAQLDGVIKALVDRLRFFFVFLLIVAVSVVLVKVELVFRRLIKGLVLTVAGGVVSLPLLLVPLAYVHDVGVFGTSVLRGIRFQRFGAEGALLAGLGRAHHILAGIVVGALLRIALVVCCTQDIIAVRLIAPGGVVVVVVAVYAAESGYSILGEGSDSWQVPLLHFWLCLVLVNIFDLADLVLRLAFGRLELGVRLRGL